MNNIVKNVFLVIMGVTVAVILYMVFFGTTSFIDDTSLVGTKTGNITQQNSWQGVIWYMARSIETPISRYYYEYCYLPNIHQNDYVDEALGGTMNSSYYNGDLQKTETDLSYNAFYPYADLYDFPFYSNKITHYSTGWQ